MDEGQPGVSVPEGNIPLRFEAPPSNEIEGMGSSPLHGMVLHLRGCEGCKGAANELYSLGGAEGGNTWGWRGRREQPVSSVHRRRYLGLVVEAPGAASDNT